MPRLDGIAHWMQILDHTLWLMVSAGIKPIDIQRAISQLLVKHRRTPVMRMPSPEVLEYARVLTHWRNQAGFIDARGKPLTLPLKDTKTSFKHLVREALPGADANDVLTVLQRHQLIAVTIDGNVSLLSKEFLPQTTERAQFFAYTLAALEGILLTCTTNLTAKKPADNLGCLQRTAFAERFDLRYLRQYDIFLRKQAAQFLIEQDAWLKRHERKSKSRRKAGIAQVGVGVFGFRAH